MVRLTLLTTLAGAASANVSRCIDALDSLLTDAPRPPFHITAYNACGPLPTSLLPAFSSYLEAAKTWNRIHSSALTSALALCPTTGPISEIRPTCPLTEFLGSGAPTMIATLTSTPNADANANAGENTGHRETGLAWAAGAIAGFLGIAAVL